VPGVLSVSQSVGQSVLCGRCPKKCMTSTAQHSQLIPSVLRPPFRSWQEAAQVCPKFHTDGALLTLPTCVCARWAKGNLQNSFTMENTLFDARQPLVLRLLWNVASIHYMTSSFYFPLFLAVPVLGIMFSWWPISFNLWFAASFTAYYAMSRAVLYFDVRSLGEVS
jgi:hypothetical protein